VLNVNIIVENIQWAIRKGEKLTFEIDILISIFPN